MTDSLEMSPERMIEALNKEIERLRETVFNLCVANGKLEDERDDLREEVGRATVLLNDVTIEVVDARKQIREMNGRIDNLHWRGRS